MVGGMGREDDPFRETLAERVANTRARQAGQAGQGGSGGLGHGTTGFHGTPPNSSTAWTSTAPAGRPAGHPPPVHPSATPPAPVRPCWYESPWGRQPALLLQWRRDNAGRHLGLIVAAAPDETGAGWTVIRLWVDSAMLSPSRS
jgi:hypothetical protein